MRPEDFKLRLAAASFYATRFAATMVQDRLPYEFRYCAILNSSYDRNHEADEVLYPEDDSVIHKDISADDVVSLLCRNDRVPQWIDIAVAYKSADYSHLALTCCGRFHSDDERLYYYSQGTQPFGIKSPVLPKDYKDGRRFRLPSRNDFLSCLQRFHQNTPQAEQGAAANP